MQTIAQNLSDPGGSHGCARNGAENGDGGGRGCRARSALALEPRAAGAGPHQCRFRGARRFPPPACLPARPGEGGAEGVEPRRAAALRRQQHPLCHGHQDRRMGARQALPLRAAGRRSGAGLVGFRLRGRASPALLRLAAGEPFPRRDAGDARHGAAFGRADAAPRRGDRGPHSGGGRGGPAARRRSHRAGHVAGARSGGHQASSTASR